MDDADEAPLRYYDRHIADWSPPPNRGRRFFAWIDLYGVLLPLWLVLFAVAIGTPIVAIVRGAASAVTFAGGVGFYGGISVMFFIVPYAAAYLAWRIAGRDPWNAAGLAVGSHRFGSGDWRNGTTWRR